MVRFFYSFFWGGKGLRVGLLGGGGYYYLGENTLGSWTWLFILQADLDCKRNPSNSSDAQQDRASQGLFKGDLSKKLNIDGRWTSPVRAARDLITTGQRDKLGQGREKPGKATQCSLNMVQKVTIRFRQLKKYLLTYKYTLLNPKSLSSKSYKTKEFLSFTFAHRCLFFLQILSPSVLIIVDETRVPKPTIFKVLMVKSLNLRWVSPCIQKNKLSGKRPVKSFSFLKLQQQLRV